MGPSQVIETLDIQATSSPSSASDTAVDENENVAGTLHLRGGPISNRRVVWQDDVIDNEGMGKKKSKICCIFHKQREFGESSSEESSSSSDSSDDECHSDSSKNSDVRDRKRNSHKHSHSHGRRHRRVSSPNAYEKQPKYKTKPKAPVSENVNQMT
ncbi:phosphatase inhibitor-domain-containing protein [Dipodascopsis uninucleata]